MNLDVRGKRVTVMGLGIHGGGLGVSKFLAHHGAIVTVTDMRSAEQLEESINALHGYDVRYVLGEHRDSDFSAADIVVRNPGVPRESRYLQIARAAGAQIEMEMTLFFRLCPAPILGITGTKGKTTTTLLTGAMLREQWPNTVVAGNLRISALEQLDIIQSDTPVVLELSSWQLEGLGEARLSPPFACVTNLSPDHLDRYASLEEYGVAKQQIFLHQGSDGVLVLPSDDPNTRDWDRLAPGNVIRFSAADADKWPQGILMGEHNARNIAAAAALARAFGTPDAAIARAITHFTGVEHRMEIVREIGGVRFINDTAATTPTAAAASLQAISSPVILIAGGADKKLEWAPLVHAIQGHPHLRGVVLLNGTASAALASELKHAEPLFDDFATAIQAAYSLAEPNTTVLLSPGAASFGMFRNEFHRGEEFRRIVGALT